MLLNAVLPLFLFIPMKINKNTTTDAYAYF